MPVYKPTEETKIMNIINEDNLLEEALGNLNIATAEDLFPVIKTPTLDALREAHKVLLDCAACGDVTKQVENAIERESRCKYSVTEGGVTYGPFAGPEEARQFGYAIPGAKSPGFQWEFTPLLPKYGDPNKEES